MSKNVELFTEVAQKLEKKIVLDTKKEIMNRLLSESYVQLEGYEGYYIEIDRVIKAVKGEENDN